MEAEYFVQIGNREAEDDGKTLLHAGDFTPICSDCERGHLQWAEAGYVPWHRICDVCGSHWDLHPIGWGPARAGDRPVEVQMKPYTRTELIRYADECGHDDPARATDNELREYLGDFLTPLPAVDHATVDSDTLVRWVDGRGAILLDRAERISEECPYTWGDLVDLITPEMWDRAEADKARTAGSATVCGAWAQRARFYGGR